MRNTKGVLQRRFKESFLRPPSKKRPFVTPGRIEFEQSVDSLVVGSLTKAVGSLTKAVGSLTKAAERAACKALCFLGRQGKSTLSKIEV